MHELCVECRKGHPGEVCLNGCETAKRVLAALNMPMRNCDVGTAEEGSDK
jgi:hypothetical protein